MSNDVDATGPATPLTSDAGEFAVFYGSAAGEVNAEHKFPDGPGKEKVFGSASYVMSRAIATSETVTVGAIMRAIRALPDTVLSQLIQELTFASTDPELVLVAEARPERPLTQTGIVIDNPEPTRGSVALVDPEVLIEGRVLSRGAPINVEVNGRRATLTDGGGFQVGVELSAGVNRITVFAITRENEAISHSFELFYEGDIRAMIGQGRDYAVLIANQDYADGSGLADLVTPIGDAEAVGRLLRERYGFVTKAQLPDGGTLDLVLTDATQRDIGLTLDRLSRIVGPSDTVLVFYAGHGEYEQLTGAAYWLPVDAVAGAFSTFIEASSITRALQRMPAGNVLVISDSCYSGMLLRSGADAPDEITGERLAALQRLDDQRSRVVLSSGGNTPVLDGGGDGHSVFAAALLEVLADPPDSAFSARELHGAVFSRVIQRAAQEPDFRPIDGAGHDGGDFVFLVRE